MCVCVYISYTNNKETGLLNYKVASEKDSPGRELHLEFTYTVDIQVIEIKKISNAKVLSGHDS